jgi:hypothetical protein
MSLIERFRDVSSELRHAAFEQKFFRGGKLRFDYDEYASEALAEYHERKQWYRKAGWSPDLTESALAIDRANILYIMKWQQYFDGHVPRNWDIYNHKRADSNVETVFEEAGRKGIQLSRTLIDAGVSYDHPFIAEAVVENQRLNETQLAFLYARGNVPEGSILSAQREKGVSREENSRAWQIARDIRVKEKRDQIPSKDFLEMALFPPYQNRKRSAEYCPSEEEFLKSLDRGT